MTEKIPILIFTMSLVIPPSEQFVGNDIFNSADERLFEMFCVETSQQLAGIATTTRTHEMITREGVKDSLIEYFKSLSGDEPFEVPEDATLSEVYQAFYGECASPERFLAAVQSIVDACVDFDSQPVLKEDPDLHFDAEHVSQAQKTLSDRNKQINTAITSSSPNYGVARSLLGQSLHTIQKFYSHTSWVENGNSEIADLLEPYLPVAGNETATCDNTCTDDCSDNLLTNELTSGYFPFHNRPEWKCLHGGSLDKAYAGINKDTSSACFSPHFSYHQAAADLAILATTNYVNNIRSAVGDLKFGSLFDLSNSSALAILLDTSSSMGNEIEAVKLEIIQIIDEAEKTGVAPSEYFLAAYETQIQFTRTKDPEEIKRALSSLTPAGGTEFIFTAAQMVLAQAPEFTDIIAFTDEPGDDYNLQSTVIGLAQDKKCKFHVVWTEPTGTAPGLEDTCAQTGGLFMESDKTDVYDIVALLSRSIESSKATLIDVILPAGSETTTFPVDSSLSHEDFRIGVTINGRLSEAVLTSADGSIDVNLLDDTSIAESPLEIQVVYRGDSLLTLTFKPNMVGIWSLLTTTSTNQEVVITASCTFNFIASFKLLDVNTTHPNMRTIQGKPVASSTPVIAVQLTAASRTKISSIDTLTLVTPDGATIGSYPRTNTDFSEDFYVTLGNDRIPSETFLIRLEGKDTAGNLFWRLRLPAISPASTAVEVTSSSSRIEAAPGESVSAEYLIRNFGEPTTIIVEVADDKNFLSTFTPQSFTIGKDESQTTVATFVVPENAPVGTVSLILVTASSQWDGSQNFAKSSLVVISNIDDTVKPEISSSNTDCKSASVTTCKNEFWTFSALTWDRESGLGVIRVDGFDPSTSNYNLTVPPFTPGTLENVTIEFNADCCVRKAVLTVFDVAGNVNSTNFDQGAIRDCGQVYVCPTCINATSIYVLWHEPCAVDEWQRVDHYLFTLQAEDGNIDSIKTSYCGSKDCNEPIVNLRSCVTYNMTLEAFQSSTESTGDVEFYEPLIFTTLEQATSPPESVSTVNTTGTSVWLKWFPPRENKECTHHYHVCYRAMPVTYDASFRADEKCEDTPPVGDDFSSEYSYELSGLESCTNYRIVVTAVTAGGKKSRETMHMTTTGFQEPNIPTTFRIITEGPKEVTLCWNEPTANPRCVQRYYTSFYSCPSENTEGLEIEDSTDTTVTAEDTTPTSTTMFTSTVTTTSSTTITTTTTDPFLDCAYIETISGLQACTCYNFTLSMTFYNGSTLSDMLSVSTSTSLTDDGIRPPDSVSVQDISQRFAYVSWFPPEEDFSCVDGYRITATNVDYPTETGFATVEADVFSWYIDILSPCTRYEVGVQSLAQNLESEPTTAMFSTTDDVPGLASNIEINEIFSDGFAVSWCDPTTDPQCAINWDRDVTEDTHESSDIEDCKIAERGSTDGVVKCWNLELRSLPCGTKHLFKLWASSPTGKIGPTAVCRVETKPC